MTSLVTTQAKSRVPFSHSLPSFLLPQAQALIKMIFLLSGVWKPVRLAQMDPASCTQDLHITFMSTCSAGLWCSLWLPHPASLSSAAKDIQGVGAGLTQEPGNSPPEKTWAEQHPPGGPASVVDRGSCGGALHIMPPQCPPVSPSGLCSLIESQASKLHSLPLHY